MDPTTEKVFCNTVVWRRLGNCLNFSDLKDLRLVCRNFNQAIVENTTFKNRALVYISIDRIVKRNGFRTTEVQWKNIKFDVASSVELQEKLKEENGEVDEVSEDAIHWIYSKLQSVESLNFSGKNLTGNSPIVFTFPSISRILEASENLKTLAIDVNILNETGNALLFANPSEKFTRTLQNLTDFRIFSPHYGVLEAGRNSDFTDSIAWIGKHLKSVQVMNIGRLAIEDTNSDNSVVDYELFLKIQNLIRVIQTNKNKITNLLLDDQILWMTNPDNEMHSITKTVFPILKSIKIRMVHNTSDLKKLINFISKEPLLEEISLTYLKHLPNELLNVIRSKSTNLKKLRIKTKGIIQQQQNNSTEQDNVLLQDIETVDEENNMWNFLSELTNLKEFELDLLLSREDQSFITVQSYKKVLINLPRSIKIISLSGFPYLDNGFITGHDFNNLNPLNITQLILKKCPDAVNDETMEFICKNLKMLQVLHIAKSSTLTDYGITGVGEWNENSEFSIKDLKGLKSLTIRRCKEISDGSCCAIQFQELAYLDISHNDKITPNGIMQILSRNPSLETLKTAEFNELPPEMELLAKFPRLKIHTFSYDGESESEDDSNFDGSSVSGFGPRYQDDDFEDDFCEWDEDDDFDDNEDEDDEY